MAQYGIPFLLIGIILGNMIMYFLFPYINSFSQATFIHGSEDCTLRINETSGGGMIYINDLDEMDLGIDRFSLIYGISDNAKYMLDLKQVASRKGGSRTFEAIRNELTYDHGYSEEDSQMFFSVYPESRYSVLFPTNIMASNLYFPEVLLEDPAESGKSFRENIILKSKSSFMLTNFLFFFNFSFNHGGSEEDIHVLLPLFPYLNFGEMSPLNWTGISDLEDFMETFLDQLVLDERSLILKGEVSRWDLKEILIQWDSSSGSHHVNKVTYEINGEERILDLQAFFDVFSI